ncbi:MAG: PIG-L family deacetylase [Kofleriaceae bacterium]
MRALVIISLLAACGDNQHGVGLPLAPAETVAVIAHQDDDLIFMQPDLPEAIARGAGLLNIYVTAGNDGKGPEKANPRYAGLMAAYGAIANDHDWLCGWISIDSHIAQHCRLEAENISLVFLAYPDGGIKGEEPGSLLSLWEGKTTRVTTVADRTTSYDREELIATIATILETVHPSTIHTLDLPATHGRDHADHQIVGALAGLATMRLDYEPTLYAHRGYEDAREPPNKAGAVLATAIHNMSYYEACVYGCGECGQPCDSIDHSHQVWMSSRYALGFRKHARGRLVAQSGQCLAMTGLVDCTEAPVWTLADRTLSSDAGALDGRWLYDDEGHLWSSTPPDIHPDLGDRHMRCLFAADDGALGTGACGDFDAYTWTWAPEVIASPQPFAATGRAVRIGDVDGDGFGDLCTIAKGNLVCALGRGNGHFGRAHPIAPLDVDPQSLALGDLDGDGVAEACGHTADGIVCAGTGLFTPSFGADASAATPASIRIEAGHICGIAAEGVVCSTSGASFDPQIVSAFPQPTDPLLPGSLDQDPATDWCTLTATGPLCAVTSESQVSTDGLPWAWSMNKQLDLPPTDPALVDLADIDGSGTASLCGVYGNDVGCARSNLHGFGPHTIVASFPTPPSAVWFGDLNGDGRADVCADLGPRISCALL